MFTQKPFPLTIEQFEEAIQLSEKNAYIVRCATGCPIAVVLRAQHPDALVEVGPAVMTLMYDDHHESYRMPLWAEKTIYKVDGCLPPIIDRQTVLAIIEQVKESYSE